jgi:hypothetical protein
MADVIPQGFNPEKDGIFKTPSHFDKHLFVGQESNGMNLFKSEMSLIGEDAGVMKSMRALKPALKTDPVPETERVLLTFYKKKKIPLDRKVTISGDDFWGFD